MLRKLDYGADGKPVSGDGYDEHAAAVTWTAAVLTGAGYGTPLSWQTEIAHKLPYGYAQYADLTMRAPDAAVPAILLEIDHVTEPVDDLVDKLRHPGPPAAPPPLRPPAAEATCAVGNARSDPAPAQRRSPSRKRRSRSTDGARSARSARGGRPAAHRRAV
ncbi:hypothetical protein [Streptomyces ipomoeae]|uniref:hypothetical protein n=1 Tax=Streptomyces ipomoeae TaxID=103232 RepID=UPI001FD25C25|nr:hypothetical protein [Streptomyces ipomoeae]MDX2935566.1 hypothetical protein [Streptomyces ipomoeae]